jgi:hypothetical protein
MALGHAQLNVQITTYISDEPQPGMVACEFPDATGRIHTLIDKVAIFTAARLNSTTAYPQPGMVACDSIGRSKDEHGREIVRIRIADNLCLESTEGLSEFVVLAEQLKC